jgi:hypothetical protein
MSLSNFEISFVQSGSAENLNLATGVLKSDYSQKLLNVSGFFFNRLSNFTTIIYVNRASGELNGKINDLYGQISNLNTQISILSGQVQQIAAQISGKV